jgi:RNase P/RNase MRP subunit p29
MAKLLKLRRGTTSQHSSFTGAEGEVTVDTTKDTLVVHDGSTAGGVPIAKESAVNLKANLASPTFTGTVTTANVATDGQYIQQEETLTVSSNATTVDCSTGNYFTVQAAGNITFTFGTPPADTKSYAMVIEVDHNSGTLTWPASVKWNADTAPELTAAKTHQFYFHTNNGGTRWRGAALVDYVD